MIPRDVERHANTFADVPFNPMGGLGRAHELFGDNLAAILDELNMRLAA